MIKESKYCSDVMKKKINKELVTTKKDNKNFENSIKGRICLNAYFDDDIKLRDHCHITGKCRSSAHRDCNINVKLNHKLPAECHNLKNYDLHLIIQELHKFNLKTSVIPNALEKYISFSFNSKLNFIDSFQFVSSSLYSLGKN